MLRAKLIAMCVCPAVLAPPAILAVHRPARHAVSNLLQRTAHRLDNRIPATIPAPAPVAQFASIPCAPTLAAAEAGPIVGGVSLANLSPSDPAIFNGVSRAADSSTGAIVINGA